METREQPGLCLDFLLEERRPLGVVTLAGQSYELMPLDVVEDLMRLTAVCERARVAFDSVGSGSDVSDIETMTSALESVASELRGLIRQLVPGMTDDTLRHHFPKVSQLQNVFTLLVLEIKKHMPDSVKKNSE